MNAKNEGVTSGLDRLNALLVWWGIPNVNSGENVAGQIKRFQGFTSDLQNAYGEAYHQQMGALLTANERLTRSFQEFLHCRQPHEVIAAESAFFETFLEGASLQAKTWVDLTQKVQECCAAIAREAVAEVNKRPQEETGTKPAARPAQVPDREANKHLAHA